MRQNRGWQYVIIASAAICVVTSPSLSYAVDGWRTVVLKSDSVPGVAGGVFDGSSFNYPSINSSGKVAFQGGLETGQGGVTSINDSGIWAEGSSGLELIVRENDTAPGQTAHVFTEFGSGYSTSPTSGVPFNRHGDVSFYADLDVLSPGEEAAGIWKKLAGGSLGIVDSRVDDEYVFTFSAPVLNDSGETAFSKTYSYYDSGEDEVVHVESIRSESGSGLHLVFSTENGSVLDPTINVAGETMFRRVSITTGNAYITSDGGGSLYDVATSGTHAPGTPAGIMFYSLTANVHNINSAGQTVFYDRLTDGMDFTGTGIWSNGGGNLQLIAQEGGSPADYPTETFTNFLSGVPLIDNEGNSTFFAKTDGSQGGGFAGRDIWTDRGGSVNAVVRVGDPHPGGFNGVEDAGFGSQMEFSINGRGQVVIGESGAGIWATDCGGTLQRVIGLNDEINFGDELNPDFKTVAGVSMLNYSNSHDGTASPINDRGQIVFAASFYDAQNTIGIFVSDAVATPLLEADFNEDGYVDNLDFALWEVGIGTQSGAAHDDGDADADGDVDYADFYTWQQQFGSLGTCNSPAVAHSHATTVPEPSTALLAMLMTAFCTLPRPVRRKV